MRSAQRRSGDRRPVMRIRREPAAAAWRYHCDPKAEFGTVSTVLAQEGSADRKAAKPRHLRDARRGRATRARRAVLQAQLMRRIHDEETDGAHDNGKEAFSEEEGERATTRNRKLGATGPADLGRHGPAARDLQPITPGDRPRFTRVSAPKPAHEGDEVPVGDVDAEPLHQSCWPRPSAGEACPAGDGEERAAEAVRADAEEHVTE
jgi:hypothetical protein